ncbi:MAG TPA: DUF697 domain-containing protein [Armatimonadetes bacterium]|nr:DUF697 domain-containing protein [Armatimonadota bacterium]
MLAMDEFERTRASLAQLLNDPSITPAERQAVEKELEKARTVLEKLEQGEVRIAVVGIISSGKSSLLNALIGQSVFKVHPKGGTTKEVQATTWETQTHALPGLGNSRVVLVDTPGLGEVAGEERAEKAFQAAEEADLVLFVVCRDMTDEEYAALLRLQALGKPLMLVFNMIDLFRPQERRQLREVFERRLGDFLPPENIVEVAADPLPWEVLVQKPDGTTERQWRKRPPEIEPLRERLLDMLAAEGKELLAINALLQMQDVSETLRRKRFEYRRRAADRVIWSYTVANAAAVALNPVPMLDLAGDLSLTVALLVHLAVVFGQKISRRRARVLRGDIVHSLGRTRVVQTLLKGSGVVLKALTPGLGHVAGGLVQGLATGYSTFILGWAAVGFFENNGTWGEEGIEAMVQRAVQRADETNLTRELRRQLLHKFSTRFGPGVPEAASTGG